MRENIGKSILDSLISPVWTVTTSLVLVQIPISPLKIQLLIVKQKICQKNRDDLHNENTVICHTETHP